MIGSLLRVDPKINKIQVIAIGHTRELVNQTYDVYRKAVKYAPQYKIFNTASEGQTGNANSSQVVVSTLGKVLQMMKARDKLDLSHLKAFVLDEADDFFMEYRREEELN